jgi:hypothetical protein
MSYRPSYENYDERERDSRPGGRHENDGEASGLNRGARDEGDGYARSEGRRTQEGDPSEHYRREHGGYGNNDVRSLHGFLLCFINVTVLSHIQGFRGGDHPRQGGYGGESSYGSGPRRDGSPGRSYGGNDFGRREDRAHDSHGIGRRSEEDTYGRQQQPYREGGGSYGGRPSEESYGGKNNDGSSGSYRRDDGPSYGGSSGSGEHGYNGSGGSSRYESNERNENNQYRQSGQHTGTGGGAYGSSGYGNRNDGERRSEEGRKTTSETHTSSSNAEPVSSISYIFLTI